MGAGLVRVVRLGCAAWFVAAAAVLYALAGLLDALGRLWRAVRP